MTIKNRLISSSILLIILFIFVCTSLFLGYRNISLKTSIAYQLNKESTYLQMLLRGLNEILLSEGTPDTVSIARNALKRFDSIHVDLLSLAENPSLREKLKQTYSEFNDIRVGVEPYLEHHYFDPDEDVELLMRYGGLIRKTERINNEINVLAENIKAELDSSQRENLYFISIFSLCILIVIGIYLFRLYKSVTHPLKELINVADAFNKGDLIDMTDTSKKDKSGSLARHFNKSIIKLKRINDHRNT